MPSAKPITGINDLETLFPDIAKEWHPNKNGDLKTTDVKTGSNKPVWWQCSKFKDHEWETVVYSRTGKDKKGCPVCAGKKVLTGFNDLQTSSPAIAMEWHPTKNGNLKPANVANGRNKPVWWQCSKFSDHAWEASPNDRTRTDGKATGCPICDSKQLLVGFNDLQTTCPEITKEWHPTKNGDLKPTDISKGNKELIWWQCPAFPDHAYQTTPNRRTTNGIGCSICSGHQILVGFNDLLTTHPEIAKEWHPTKNGNLKPTDISKGSKDPIWWQCKEFLDHEWQVMPNRRTSRFTGCPICSGNKLLVGFNDLKTTHPAISKEWHQTKNGNLKPTDLTRGSGQKVWWQCFKYPNHEWIAAIGSRTGQGSGCPDCAEFGFNTGEDAWFYLMARPGEQQIGITNNIKQRVRFHSKNGWTLLDKSRHAAGRIVLDAETKFKRWLRQEIGLIAGKTENWATTSLEVHSLAELKARSGIETDIF